MTPPGSSTCLSPIHSGAFTWDIRTIQSTSRITPFLDARLALTKPRSFALDTNPPPALGKLYDDLAWIQAFFKFETDVGNCFRIFRQDEGRWKAHVMFTNLEELTSFTELSGPRRSYAPNQNKWLAQCNAECEFASGDPTVLIIGGWQTRSRLEVEVFRCFPFFFQRIFGSPIAPEVGVKF
jgi:hypothetical protein